MRTEIQILASTFTAVGTSAWETLEVCDRQARKDVAKIQRWLESEDVSRAKRRAVVTAQWTAAVLLAVGAVCFVLGQEFRSWADRFVADSLEAEPDTETVLGEAIAALPAGPLAGSLPLAEVVKREAPAPLFSEVAALFAEADRIGDAYLEPSEIEAREAAMVAIAEVFSGMPPHRPGGGRRRRIEALFAQAEEMRQRTAVSDAALLTVAQVAVNTLG